MDMVMLRVKVRVRYRVRVRVEGRGIYLSVRAIYRTLYKNSHVILC